MAPLAAQASLVEVAETAVEAAEVVASAAQAAMALEDTEAVEADMELPALAVPAHRPEPDMLPAAEAVAAQVPPVSA